MGLLGVLGNTTRSKFMALSSRILSSGTPACVLAPACNLNNDSYKLKLLVQHVFNRTRDYSVISTENDSFQVVKDNLPNYSFLRDEKYFYESSLVGYRVLSSCNIWILLSCAKIPLDPRYLLWNPKTNEIKSLPYFEVQPSVPRAIDVIERDHGIGFDPLSQDYKVVRSRLFELIGIGKEAHVELFSLATGSWKEIPYPHDPCIEPFQYNSLHINGFYYWLALDAAKDDSFCIISFDFANEKFPPALIPAPPSTLIPLSDNKYHNDKYFLRLGVYHGSLAAIVYNFDAVAERKHCFEIWVWDSNIDEWSCVSTFDVPSAAAPVDNIVGLYKNDKLLLQDCEGDLLLYDYVEDNLKNLGIHADILGVDVFPYLESSPFG